MARKETADERTIIQFLRPNHPAFVPTHSPDNTCWNIKMAKGYAPTILPLCQDCKLYCICTGPQAESAFLNRARDIGRVTAIVDTLHVENAKCLNSLVIDAKIK